MIRIETKSCQGAGVGSGFLLAPRLLATVEHVVDGAQRITLKRAGQVIGNAVVIGADRDRDLALLRADSPIQGFHFRLSKRMPRLGDEVAALGFPLGLPLTVTRGSVSGLQRAIPIDGVTRRRLVQTDAAVNQGNSGGPLLELRSGEVIGLVDLGTTEANGIAFAVSADVAGPLLEAWGKAPQPISNAGTCETEEEAPAPVPDEVPGSRSEPGVASFIGKYFAIDYPAGWDVETAEVSKGGYLDTTIRDPGDRSVLLRVDVIPNENQDPIVNAGRVRSAVSRQRGYRELEFSRMDLGGYAAVRWEFLVEEDGTRLHKVDVFLLNEAGDGIAVLTQAPEAKYYRWSEVFDGIRNSLTSGTR